MPWPTNARHEEPESELIGDARNGDLDAMAELFRRHYPYSITLARRILRVREEFLDAVQSAYLSGTCNLGQATRLCYRDPTYGALIQALFDNVLGAPRPRSFSSWRMPANPVGSEKQRTNRALLLQHLQLAGRLTVKSGADQEPALPRSSGFQLLSIAPLHSPHTHFLITHFLITG